MSYLLDKYAKYILTKEQVKEHEKYIDNLSLDHHVVYNNKTIKTIKINFSIIKAQSNASSVIL